MIAGLLKYIKGRKASCIPQAVPAGVWLGSRAGDIILTRDEDAAYAESDCLGPIPQADKASVLTTQTVAAAFATMLSKFLAVSTFSSPPNPISY
jgi:hypothetical protein